MKELKIELKWSLIFSVVGLVWIFLEKISGLHHQYIDYHLYLTNLFAIPAIVVMVMALKDKKENYFNHSITYPQGLVSGIILSLFIKFLYKILNFPFPFWLLEEIRIIKKKIE